MTRTRGKLRDFMQLKILNDALKTKNSWKYFLKYNIKHFRIHSFLCKKLYIWASAGKGLPRKK